MSSEYVLLDFLIGKDYYLISPSEHLFISKNSKFPQYTQ